MGRGIVESGLFRSERLGLEQRTTDPSSYQDGEAWVRTDLAPDTDQIGTLRFNKSGTLVDIPIFDDDASTSDITKAFRVPINGATGFVPFVESGGVNDFLRLQHNSTWLGAHDSLTAIPDSGISRYEFEQDVADSWGNNDGTDNSSSGYSTDAEVGSYAKSFDGVDDRVELPDLGLNSGSSFSVSTWVHHSSSGSPTTLIGRYDGNDDIIDLRKLEGDEVRLLLGHTGNNIIATSSGSISADSYHHVVGVFDHTGPTVTVYIDGSQDGSATGSIPDFATGSGPWIGARSDINLWYGGLQDDVRFYDKALSSTEVSNLNSTGSISG